MARGPELRSEPVVTELAQRYGRTPAQILLRWHIELGVVPVPKSEDPQRLRENIAVFDFTLTPEDVARLSALNRGDELMLDPETFGH
jgi:2,5-diketo-D-gluconate reductase A